MDVWIFPVLLLLVGVFVISTNIVLIIRWLISSRPTTVIPLVGGCCTALGVFLVPDPAVSQYWWLALFLDYGTIPLLTRSAYFVYVRRSQQ